MIQAIIICFFSNCVFSCYKTIANILWSFHHKQTKTNLKTKYLLSFQPPATPFPYSTLLSATPSRLALPWNLSASSSAHRQGSTLSREFLCLAITVMGRCSAGLTNQVSYDLNIILNIIQQSCQCCLNNTALGYQYIIFF